MDHLYRNLIHKKKQQLHESINYSQAGTPYLPGTGKLKKPSSMQVTVKTGYGKSGRSLISNNEPSPLLKKDDKRNLALRASHQSAALNPESQQSGLINPMDSTSEHLARYKRPPARDGHCGVVVRDRYLFVFGGDRHRMPFNDSFLLDIEEEFKVQSYVL